MANQYYIIIKVTSEQGVEQEYTAYKVADHLHRDYREMLRADAEDVPQECQLTQLPVLAPNPKGWESV
jgi:hypothetical protein